MMFWQTFRAYYYLSKPGIVYGNALMAAAGYFFGALGQPSLVVFISLLLGISMVMASACASNNVMDRDIDALMDRTRRRALPSGTISASHALIYATIMVVVGLTILAIGTTILAAVIALAGHVAYVVLYGIAKRKTVHGTLVGTISGSTPPVIGYVAATGALDVAALLLFLVLVAWQMPHFYAIAIFRLQDYKKASIPVLPLVKGLTETRHQIIAYVLLYIVFVVLLFFLAGLSLIGTLVLLLSGLYWLYVCVSYVGNDNETSETWARRQFIWSLKLLLILSVALSLDSFLH